MKKIHLVPTLIILTSVVLTLIPFLKPGLFDVHDPTSAFRLSTLIGTIRSGQFPAAWNNNLNFGFGYPLHLYYAPLFTYLGAMFVPFISVEVAVKLALFIASLVGSYGVYFLLSSIGSYAATLAAVAFTFLPYRASALYVRGSYSEFLAMSLLPWVLYLWQKPQKNTKTIILTGLVTALFILSHNTLPILLVPIIILLIGLYQLKFIKGSFFAFLTTVGLSAWFILPVFFERSFVQVEGVARLTNFRDHFLALSQLWSSPWGYGGSGTGITNDHMSFMIGKGQLLLALLGASAIIWQKKWKILALYGSIVVLFVFLSLSSSSIIWQIVPMLSLIQFPWRTLSMIGIGVAALSGLSLTIIPQRWQLITLLLFSSLLIYTNIKYFRPQEYRTYSAETLSNPTILAPLARDKIPEYLPSWMPNFPGSAVEDGLSRTATTVSGTIITSDTSPLTLSTAYMPQWHLTLNGSPEPIKPNQAGLVTTINDVHSGSNTISLTWHRTLIENLGLGISGITIMVMIGLLLI